MLLLLISNMIALLLLIDQGLFNLLIISQSIHSQRARTQSQSWTQLRYVGFQTIGSISDEIDYNEYITRREP